MEEKKMNDFETRIAERMISGIAGAIIVASGVVAVGTAALPVVLAHHFHDWRWMLAYPCILAVCGLMASRKKH